MSNSKRNVLGSLEESPWKLGRAIKGMGLIGASPATFLIGKSIEELTGSINTLQYSLGISTGFAASTWSDSTVGGFTALH